MGDAEELLCTDTMRRKQSCRCAAMHMCGVTETSLQQLTRYLAQSGRRVGLNHDISKIDTQSHALLSSTWVASQKIDAAVSLELLI